jgi:hypothetical protein
MALQSAKSSTAPAVKDFAKVAFVGLTCSAVIT